MVNQAFDELKLTGRLPSPPGVGMAILELTENDDYSTQDIARAIQSDPALTGRVLKVTNSARNAAVRPITTVDEAVNRLGVTRLQTIALGFSLVSACRDGACRAFDYDRFWSLSLARAVAAQSVSQELGIANPAESYSCALLTGIGRLALASVHAEAYADILDECSPEDAQRIAQLERIAFEIDHYVVGHSLMIDWGLPPEHARTMLLFEDEKADLSNEDPVTRDLVTVLRLANRIAEVLVANEETSTRQWNDLECRREVAGLEPDAFHALCDDIAAQWTDWGAILDVTTAKVPKFAELAEIATATDDREAIDEVEAETERSLKILAVDDERLSLRLLARQLEEAGHEVMCASTGREALSIALQHNPDLVVSDWNMPEMDGLELCTSLRRFESGTQTYFILLTGTGEEDRIVEAFDAGIDDYVTKPFNPKVLLARVRAGRRVVTLKHRVSTDKLRMQEQVANLAVLNRKLEKSSLTDALTELPNRRAAMQRLCAGWDERARTGRNFACLMMDIDHFKVVNDTHGHDVGDEVLRKTAAVIRHQVRDYELGARLGGEEFLVVCVNVDEQEAAICAERIRAAIEENHISFGDFEGNITVSIGVAVAGPEHKSFDDVLKSADEAVYAAKHAGRNRVAWASSTTPANA